MRRIAVLAGLLAAAMGARQDARADLPDTAIPIGAATEFGAQASWRVPSAAEVRAAVLNCLDRVSNTDGRKPAGEVRQQIEKLWPANEPVGIAGDELLDRVGQSIAAIEPATKEIVEFCSKHRESIVAPDFTVLADEKLDPFVRNNLRLLLGRWLAQHRYYDESLVQIGMLEPKDVVDPAALLFYQSVNHHWFLDKQAGLKSIGKLFEQRERLPRRYATVAMLMQADLAALKDDSLDHISRRMNDITRRLDFGRAGKKVQGVENGVIASLDKLIEELEKQQQQAAGGGGGGGQGQNRGPPQGIQSSGPARDSMPARGKGPGNIGKNRIGSKSGWGDLPAKEREEALQQIGKDFPSHYREIVESYFRKIAESE